jgi:hypothetical protein
MTINIDLKALELVIEEKHVMSIMQPDAGMLRQRVRLSEGNIPYTTNNMDSDEIIQKNNGVYQNPCSSKNKLECSKMYLSKVRTMCCPKS